MMCLGKERWYVLSDCGVAVHCVGVEMPEEAVRRRWQSAVGVSVGSVAADLRERTGKLNRSNLVEKK